MDLIVSLTPSPESMLTMVGVLCHRGDMVAHSRASSPKGRESGQLWPADAVERRAVADLVPYANNARTHSPTQIDHLARLITAYGWTNPVLLDEHSGIIAGHGRVMAAQQLGILDVPVMVARGWTKAQRRAYVLADNASAAQAGWDDDKLRLELGELQLEGFDLDLTGFREDQVATLLFEPNFAAASADDQGRLDEKKTAICPECGHEFAT